MRHIRRFAPHGVALLWIGLCGCKDARSKLIGFTQSFSDPVLAQVGDETIRQSEFVVYLGGFSNTVVGNGALSPELRRAILTNLIQQKILLQLAGRARVSEDPGFKKMLRDSRGSSTDDLMVRYYLSHVQSSLSVSEADVQAYSKTHAQKLKLAHADIVSALQAEKLPAALSRDIATIPVTINEAKLNSLDLPVSH